MCVCRRQRETEAKLVEEEAAKRIEALVAKRVEEELEARREEIEAEVARRVEEAKAAMEAELRAEMEARRQEILLQEKKREVKFNKSADLIIMTIDFISGSHQMSSDDCLTYIINLLRFD